jgi:hypothetical protein
MDNPPVRNDTWQCGQCKALNVIANANEQCPVCGHVRDYSVGCCVNPGDLSQSSGLFPGHPEYQDDGCSFPTAGYGMHGGVNDSHAEDMWYCPNCEDWNPSWHAFCPTCGYDPSNDAHVHDSMQYAISQGPACSDSGAGSTADGVWICANPNCQSSNAAFHWPQCGACGHDHSN